MILHQILRVNIFTRDQINIGIITCCKNPEQPFRSYIIVSIFVLFLFAHISLINYK